MSMSLNFCMSCALMTARDLMCLKLSSMSKAPSADRSLANESSMNCFASFSICFTSPLNFSITCVHWGRVDGLNTSNDTYNRGRHRGNKPETAQVGGISKAQIKSKGGPFGDKKISRKSCTVPKKHLVL